jgi:ankyrin repeat protein
VTATPLMLAAFCGREAITKLLVNKGASLQAKDEIHERTALSWAARNNSLKTADILLKALEENGDRQTIQSKDKDGQPQLILRARTDIQIWLNSLSLGEQA